MTGLSDLRFAGPKAVFDTRFPKLRLHPDGGHRWLLARIVGQQQEMLASLFGDVWSPQRAQQLGPVAQVHEDAVADAIIRGRRVDGQEPAFVRRLVESLRRTLSGTHDEALAHETTAQEWSTTRPAFLEGLAAIEAAVVEQR